MPALFASSASLLELIREAPFLNGPLAFKGFIPSGRSSEAAVPGIVQKPHEILGFHVE